MPVYAGYQGNQINRPSFSQIALGSANQLLQTERERQTLRDELAQESQNAFIEMENSAAMQGAGKEGFFQQAADSTRENLYSLYKQLTSNQITPQEYRLKKQMMMNGWGQVDQVFKTFEEKTNLYKEKIANGTATARDEMEFKALSDFSKLSDKQVYIDPKTKAMMIAKIGPNGEISGYMPVSAASKLNTNTYNKFDMDTSIDKAVSDLPKFMGVVDGELVDSPRYAEGYDLNVSKAASHMMENDNQAISIATDHLGYNIVDANTYSAMSPEQQARAVYFTMDADGAMVYNIGDAARANAKAEVEAEIKARTPYKMDPTYSQRERMHKEDMAFRAAEGAKNRAAAAAKATTKKGKGDDNNFLLRAYYIDKVRKGDLTTINSMVGKKTDEGTIKKIRSEFGNDRYKVDFVDGMGLPTGSRFMSALELGALYNDAQNGTLPSAQQYAYEDVDFYLSNAIARNTPTTTTTTTQGGGMLDTLQVPTSNGPIMGDRFFGGN